MRKISALPRRQVVVLIDVLLSSRLTLYTMTRDDHPVRISHNPSAKRIKETLVIARAAKCVTGFLKTLSINNERIESIHHAAGTALSEAEADVLDLPDRFNDAFSSDGWIATGSMSADTMRQALRLHESGERQAAADLILSWFDRDRIALFAIQRTKPFNKAINRCDQLQEALSLTFEERYWSAVPLILIACDGFTSDVLGRSPFVKGADLTVFDSIVGHPKSLQKLIGVIIKGVRKSSDYELSLPLRHGILHGQSLGYANRTVCMKAWLLMIALVDWAHDKRNEEERRTEEQTISDATFGAALQKLRKVKNDKRDMEAHQVREHFGPFGSSVDKNSPEHAVLVFLNAWTNENFGVMAERSVNLSNQSVKKMAGQLRRGAELIKLRDFELRTVRHTTVARADAVAYLKGTTLKGDVEGEFEIVAFRYSDNGEIAMPADTGTWRVQQACMYKLLHARAMDNRPT